MNFLNFYKGIAEKRVLFEHKYTKCFDATAISKNSHAFLFKGFKLDYTGKEDLLGSQYIVFSTGNLQKVVSYQFRALPILKTFSPFERSFFKRINGKFFAMSRFFSQQIYPEQENDNKVLRDFDHLIFNHHFELFQIDPV